MSQIARKEEHEVTKVMPAPLQLDANDIERGHLILIQEKKPKGLKESIPDMKEGDFVRTDLEEVITDEPLEIIILHTSRSWRLLDPNDNFRKIGGEPFQPGADAPEMGVMGDGTNYVRRLQYNYVVMLPSDLKSIPLCLALKGMSTQAAKKINHRLLTLQSGGVAYWGYTFELRSVEDTNKKNDQFSKILAKPGRATTEEEIKAAEDWYLKLSTQKDAANPEDGDEISSEGDDILF